MNITQENYQLLQEINNALGEIYTKGQDSITLVRVREALYKIIGDLHEQEHIHVNFIEQKEENNN